MKKIGLTGGIGTGKSLVANIFLSLGIPVFNADRQAKNAYNETEILQKIKALFGEVVFDQRQINFSKLSNRVFSNTNELEKLNNIIHPYVLGKFEQWIKENSEAAYVVMESAILFETCYDSLFDKIVVVDAPRELCIERVMLRDNIDRDMVLKRISNQLPNELKVQKSDFCIQNFGAELLTPQVLSIHNKILSL